MPEQNLPTQCHKCQNDFQGSYCPICGLPKEVERINGKYIFTEIGSVLNFDRGLLFTIRELFIRPGNSIRRYIHEDRNYLVKPLVFIVLCSLIYSLVQQFVNFEDGYVNFSDGESGTSNAIFIWVSKNYGYANILMSFFIAIWLSLFFRKSAYNIFEILILLCFMMGTGMLVFTFFGLLDSLTGLPITDKGFLIGILYISWGVATFFPGKAIPNFLKSFLSYMIGLFSFGLITILLGAFMDWIKV
ncbi:MAG: DUF3667 domain-containing protein [Bacteroidia bacterium]|nr:DUF3667 domain-containing protein [Bacteroidia bacterium]